MAATDTVDFVLNNITNAENAFNSVDRQQTIDKVVAQVDNNNTELGAAKRALDLVSQSLVTQRDAEVARNRGTAETIQANIDDEQRVAVATDAKLNDLEELRKRQITNARDYNQEAEELRNILDYKNEDGTEQSFFRKIGTWLNKEALANEQRVAQTQANQAVGLVKTVAATKSVMLSNSVATAQRNNAQEAKLAKQDALLEEDLANANANTKLSIGQAKLRGEQLGFSAKQLDNYYKELSRMDSDVVHHRGIAHLKLATMQVSSINEKISDEKEAARVHTAKITEWQNDNPGLQYDVDVIGKLAAKNDAASQQKLANILGDNYAPMMRVLGLNNSAIAGTGNLDLAARLTIAPAGDPLRQELEIAKSSPKGKATYTSLLHKAAGVENAQEFQALSDSLEREAKAKADVQYVQEFSEDADELAGGSTLAARQLIVGEEQIRAVAGKLGINEELTKILIELMPTDLLNGTITTTEDLTKNTETAITDILRNPNISAKDEELAFQALANSYHDQVVNATLRNTPELYAGKNLNNLKLMVDYRIGGGLFSEIETVPLDLTNPIDLNTIVNSMRARLRASHAFRKLTP